MCQNKIKNYLGRNLSKNSPTFLILQTMPKNPYGIALASYLVKVKFFA